MGPNAVLTLSGVAQVRYNVTELLMQWESELQGLVSMHYGRRGQASSTFPPCDGQAERNGSSGGRQCEGMQDHLWAPRILFWGQETFESPKNRRTPTAELSVHRTTLNYSRLRTQDSVPVPVPRHIC